MKQCCTYCKGADIVKVVDGLGVDVCNAIDTGITNINTETINNLNDISTFTISTTLFHNKIFY